MEGEPNYHFAPYLAPPLFSSLEVQPPVLLQHAGAGPGRWVHFLRLILSMLMAPDFGLYWMLLFPT